MADNDQIQSLLDSASVTLGYVYRDGQREKYWFDGTPENIASFLMRFPDADQIILTDRMDMLVLNTIGTFIDTCPDKERLSQVLTHLAPMQMGGAEPKEVFCPSDQEVNDYRRVLSRSLCAALGLFANTTISSAYRITGTSLLSISLSYSFK